MREIRFGPAGSSDSFFEMGYKHTAQMPEYLEKFGLNAFEYQCGRGVNVKQETAESFGTLCREKGIEPSLHAPYYISMASPEEQKRENSINYVLQSARAIDWMGGDRIVVHVGTCSKMERQSAMTLALETLKKTLRALDDEGLSHIRVCPEVMGKINQLGSLEETIEFCRLDERLLPCIDFGHLNARTHGWLMEKGSVEKVFEELENGIGISRLREFHSHFSKIEYTTGGEKRHLTFEDTVYGPNFEPIAEMIVKKNCRPTVICESAGTQAEDAQTMMNIYKSLLNKA